jgi:hypothetical protein
MPEKDKAVDIGTQFRALASTAASLNKASDELTHAVSVLDEALKKLNIGLTVWESFAFGQCEDPSYSADQIGYAKVNGKWGIALKSIWGNEAFDVHHEDGPWLFGEAPRQMRVQSVAHLPKLIENLAKHSIDTTKAICAKTKEVRDLVSIVEEISKEQEKSGQRGSK